MALSPEYDLFSKRQQAILGYIPLLSAPFSLGGSAVIIYVIFTDKRTKIETYQRLILGLSILGGLSSFGMIVLGPWAVPEGVDFVVGAHGTTQSCTAAGFFVQLLFGCMWYSFFLSVYFCLLIRFEWPKRKIARRMEPVAHFFVFFSAFLNNIVAISGGWINPWYVLPGWCWSAQYPPGCGNENGQVACVRGKDATALVGGGMVIFVWIGIILCMTMLVRKVERTEARLQQYAGGANNNFERTRETRQQSLFYIGAFFLVYFPLAAILMMPRAPHSTDKNRRLYFAFAFLVKLLTPLQGFFNSFIYLRKRILYLWHERGGLHFVSAWFSPMPISTAPNSMVENNGRHPMESAVSAFYDTAASHNTQVQHNVSQPLQKLPSQKLPETNPELLVSDEMPHPGTDSGVSRNDDILPQAINPSVSVDEAMQSRPKEPVIEREPSVLPPSSDCGASRNEEIQSPATNLGIQVKSMDSVIPREPSVLRPSPESLGALSNTICLDQLHDHEGIESSSLRFL